MSVTELKMKIGGRYNWKGQPERLIFLGRNWSGNGYWNQFARVDLQEKVWCEVLDSDLDMFEESESMTKDVKMPSKPTHAIHYVNNWDGEGDTCFIFAFEADGVFYNFDTNKAVLEYDGDKIINSWLLS